jgi:hypothetical protein
MGNFKGLIPGGAACYQLAALRIEGDVLGCRGTCVARHISYGTSFMDADTGRAEYEGNMWDSTTGITYRQLLICVFEQ